MSGGQKNNGTPETEEARELYRLQADIGRQQWQEYKDTGAPILRDLSSEAQMGADAPEFRDRIGAAGADVTHAYGRERERMATELGRYGINPASGRYVGAERKMGLSQAAATAGAMTRERRSVGDEAYARKLNVVGIATGQGSQAQQGLAASARGLGGIGAQREQSRNDQQAALGGLAGTAISAGAVAF